MSAVRRAGKIVLWILAVAAMIAASAVNPHYAGLRSAAAMSFYSAQESKESVQAEAGFEIIIPSGKGWSPFVMTFNADLSFEYLTGQEGARLTILYNFPAFDTVRGCSRLFSEDSPYYNSFYGAYVTELPDGSAYGFDSHGEIQGEAVAAMARLDFFGLVLGDFGLTREERVFEYSISSVERGVSLAGYGGWTYVEADMTVNGANHAVRQITASYLQYGLPNFAVSEDFAPVEMKCAVYARHFDEWGATVFFYVMVADAQVRDDCVGDILPRSVIRAK